MARKKKKDNSAFVVVRLGWTERYGADRGFDLVEPEDDDRTLGRPIAVFNDKAAAEARVAELERQERAVLNPFTFIGSDYYRFGVISSLTAEEFADRMKALAPKARLPKANLDQERDWFGWWEENADGLTEEQRQSVWDLLDRLDLYRVMTAELEG